MKRRADVRRIREVESYGGMFLVHVDDGVGSVVAWHKLCDVLITLGLVIVSMMES